MIGSAIGVVAAAAIYFAIVFGAGFLLGPIRVLWLEPWLGKTIAVLCELPFLVAVMLVAGRWVPAWVGLKPGLGPLATMGILALVFEQIADIAVGLGLRHITPQEQLAYFATPAGLIYAASLLLFAVAPALINRDRVSG